MDRVTLSSKLIVLIAILCSLNFYVVNSDYLEKKPKKFGLEFDSSFPEKNRDYDVYDSAELQSSQMSEREYLDKLRLLEYVLSGMNFKPDKPFYKRGFARSLGKDDRRRPGWELAYGKKKRSIN